jgi:4-amino-4-deoxy-L-arabinose transferase-like glycosyltransferase
MKPSNIAAAMEPHSDDFERQDLGPAGGVQTRRSTLSLLRNNSDFVLIALLLGGFVFLASQRLGTVPVPDKGNEAFMLQVPYEILHRGKIAVPLWRYLGGNIENSWHSYRPVYFLMLSGFYEVFGLGLLQGRAFNLTTAAVTLLMVYLIGRRMFDWRVGLIAVLMLVSDLLFFERSRMLRDDFAACMFALAAFYLYEMAEERKRGLLYFASGLAVGAGLMCHLNVLYMAGGICLLILMKDGFRVLFSKKPYWFGLGAFAVMGYEIVYDVVDYKNFRLQNRGDNAHFGFLNGAGWWRNVLDEPDRYVDWYANGGLFSSTPRTLTHVFQFLSAIALIYLIVRLARSVRTGGLMSEPRGRVLVITALAMIFFAIMTRKVDYYVVNLSVWFALCAGILSSDALDRVMRLGRKESRLSKVVYGVLVMCITLSVLAYGYLFARQQRSYLREVRNPELASFEEFKETLRSLVPDGICPVAVTAPVIAIAFPEADLCFASIEPRMMDLVDIEGKDYALLTRHKNPEHWENQLSNIRYLLGEVRDTPYGNFAVNYTGVDPKYLAISPRSFQMFGRWRGHVSDQQIAEAREVWKADANELRKWAGQAEADNASLDFAIGSKSFVDLCALELAPNTAYQLSLDESSNSDSEVVIIDQETGSLVKQIDIGRAPSRQHIEELFRTFGSPRVRIAIRPGKPPSNDAAHVYAMTIREVGRL